VGYDHDQLIAALFAGARRAHQDSVDCEEHAKIHRTRRDVLIRRLYATGLFTYAELAKRVDTSGCGPQAVAKIVQNRGNHAKQQ
jgi:hypothetical protein